VIFSHLIPVTVCETIFNVVNICITISTDVTTSPKRSDAEDEALESVRRGEAEDLISALPDIERPAAWDAEQWDRARPPVSRLNPQIIPPIHTPPPVSTSRKMPRWSIRIARKPKNRVTPPVNSPTRPPDTIHTRSSQTAAAC
jgi:hypothetical protein